MNNIEKIGSLRLLDNVVQYSDKMESVWKPFTNAIEERNSSFLLELSDVNKYLKVNSSSNVTVTIPKREFLKGSELVIEQTGSGIVTISHSTGITVNGILSTSEQYSAIKLVNTGLNTWTSSIQAVSSGSGGLSIQSSVIVETTDDAVVNGANLLAAYETAKTILPNGSALSATNRATVIIPPGVYDLGDDSNNTYQPLILDTEFVDIVGLSTVKEHQYIKGTPPDTLSGIIIQTADDVRIYNLTVEILTTYSANYDSTDSTAYFPNSDLPNTTINNCKFIGRGENINVGWCMRQSITYSGKYIDIEGDDGSLGSGDDSVSSGVFIRCNCRDMASGSNLASGTFIDCNATYPSAVSFGTVASGTFIRCTSPSGIGAFGFTTASGIFIDCVVNGNDSGFGAGFFGNFSGHAIRCIGGGSASFGSNTNGTNTGLVEFCKKKNGTFKTPIETGAIYASIDSNGFNAEILPV